MSEDENRASDEMRLCASCRMKVSVWATKCHYCGEELGRPRREEAKLTLKDLGGGQQTSYTPSGNVTGALESFRVEEVAAEASRAQSRPRGLFARLFGKAAPLAEPGKTCGGELAELDEYSENLAASILDDMPSSASTGRSQSRSGGGLPPVASRIVGVVGVVLGLVIAYFLVSFVWTTVSDYIEARNRPVEISYVNKAPEMLARGETSVDVFEEAIKAVRINDNASNRDIVDQVRSLLLNDVDMLLERNPWKVADQDKAYRYIQRAVNIDNHPAIDAKFDEVNAEVAAYKFVLKSVDSTGTKATFRLNHPDYEPEVEVEMADRLLDRFIVQRISKSGVDLTDDKVDGRRLSINVNEGVRSRY